MHRVGGDESTPRRRRGAYSVDDGSMLLILGQSAALSALLAVAALATAGSVLADHCGATMPAHPLDTSGFTFTARVVRIEGIDSSITPTITFAVERVYAGAGRTGLEAHRELAVVAGACGGIEILGMAVGDEVLVSSSTLTDGSSTFNSAIWRISGERLLLLALRGAEAWPTSDRRLQAADTLREALTLVAPGVVLPPDTATAATATPSPNGEPALHLVAIVGLASLLASVAWLTTRHTPPRRALASQIGFERRV